YMSPPSPPSRPPSLHDALPIYPLPGGHSSVRAAAPSVIDGCLPVDGVPMDEHDRCLAQALAATARCDDLHEHDGKPRISRRGLRSEDHTSELQSRSDLVCRLLL